MREHISLPDVETLYRGIQSVDDIITFLKNDANLHRFGFALKQSLLNKKYRYSELVSKAKRTIKEEDGKKNNAMDTLKDAARIHPDDTTDNWNIFETVSKAYIESTEEEALFKSLLDAAEELYKNVRGQPYLKEQRDKLVKALQGLKPYKISQPVAIQTIIQCLVGFLSNPLSPTKMLFNFTVTGPAGIGKTTLVRAFSNVFAASGIFLRTDMVECGRAEFIAQYEGQTVAKTLGFLTRNLDRVIFIDEAYAITPRKNGQIEGYGEEAANAIVEFITRYPGLHCICAAGYEKQMNDDFLKSNDGMSRRFPFQIRMIPLTDQALADVFCQKYMTLLCANEQELKLTANFVAFRAIEFLRKFIAACKQSSIMNCVVENEAGSMTNLAQAAAVYMLAQVDLSKLPERTPVEISDVSFEKLKLKRMVIEDKKMQHICYIHAKNMLASEEILNDEWNTLFGTPPTGSASSPVRLTRKG